MPRQKISIEQGYLTKGWKPVFTFLVTMIARWLTKALRSTWKWALFPNEG